MIGYGAEPAGPALARRRQRRAAVRPQLRGGRREQRPARRSGVRDVPVRSHWGAGISEPAHERGVAVRVRLARRALARAAGVRPAPAAADHLRRRRWRWPATRRRSPRSPPAATRSPATACVGSATSSSNPTSSASTWPRRSACMTELTGDAPLGWYTGRDSPQTRRLVVEHGGFLYDSDSYADDLPYWTRVDGQGPPGGAVHARHQRHEVRLGERIPQRHRLLHLPARRVRRAVRRRGVAGAPKMLSIGLHCRLVGRPARIAALERFLDHVQSARQGVDRAPGRHRHGTGSKRFPPGA